MKYRTSDNKEFWYLKDAKKHAKELRAATNEENSDIASTIYVREKAIGGGDMWTPKY